MTIVVNGEQKNVPAGTTVLGLLESLELNPAVVVVQHNDDIVLRAALAGTELADGDRLELVRLVAGG